MINDGRDAMSYVVAMTMFFCILVLHTGVGFGIGAGYVAGIWTMIRYDRAGE